MLNSVAPNTVISMCVSNDSNVSREAVNEDLITEPDVPALTPRPSASVPEHLSVDYFGLIPTNESFLEKHGWLSEHPIHPRVDSAPSPALVGQILSADPVLDSDDDMNSTASCLDIQEIDDVIPAGDGSGSDPPGSPYDPDDPITS